MYTLSGPHVEFPCASQHTVWINGVSPWKYLDYWFYCEDGTWIQWALLCPKICKPPTTKKEIHKKNYVVQIPTRPLNSYIEFKYYILLSISTLNQRCPLIYFRWISETYYHRRSDQIGGMRKRIVLGRTILAARVSKDPSLGHAPFKTITKVFMSTMTDILMMWLCQKNISEHHQKGYYPHGGQCGKVKEGCLHLFVLPVLSVWLLSQKNW